MTDFGFDIWDGLDEDLEEFDDDFDQDEEIEYLV
jgi:hypothetical protein